MLLGRLTDLIFVKTVREDQEIYPLFGKVAEHKRARTRTRTIIDYLSHTPPAADTNQYNYT